MLSRKTLSLAALVLFATSNLSAAATDLSGTYYLKTQSRGNGECLEGNKFSNETVGGAAFMSACDNAASQIWIVESAGSGWYRLKTQASDGHECLEGNWSDSPLYRGAAFMDTCQSVTGQLWKFLPEGSAYRLQTQFRGENECLEGNQVTSQVHEGKAFMDTCKNASGQLWLLESLGTTDENTVEDTDVGPSGEDDV